MVLWELRFTDGRGATFYTTSDVSDNVGQAGIVQRVPVAREVFEGTAIGDARRCFDAGHTVELIANMGAVAYVVRHDDDAV